MEENTNRESNEQGRESLTNNANDWRSQLEPDLRQRIISTIVAKLMILFPENDQNAITQTITKFEDKIYGTAKDKRDYMRIIMDKMHFIEKIYETRQSSSSVNGTNAQNSGGQVVLNPGQSVPTSLPYTQTPTSQQNPQRNLNALGSSVLQTQVPINVSMAPNVNTQPQNSNYMVQHQINQQLLKDKIRHGNLRPPHMQQQAQPQPQQHLQSLLKQRIPQSFPQSSGFSVLPSSGQQNSLQQNSQLPPRHQFPKQRVHSSMVLPSQDKMNVPSMQQKLLTSPQSIGEQQAFRPSYQAMSPQNDLETMHQKHFNNSEAFPSQQQQTMHGIQSGDFKTLGSSLLGTQGQEVGQSQTYQPQFPMQQQPQSRSLKNETQRFQADVLNFPHQLLRTTLANPSSMFHVLAEAQDSTGKTVNGGGKDWQEETYQRIKALKEKYLLILSAMHQKLTEKWRKAESLPPQKMKFEKLRRMKLIIEQVLVFLNVHRSNISEQHRDRFRLYEEHILNMTKNRTAIRMPMQQQQGQFPPSQTYQTALQSQIPQVNVLQSLEKDQMNSRLTLSNQNRALTSVSGLMTSQTSVPHSFQIKPKLEPKDENNTLPSSRNVVLPSIKQNPSSNLQVVQSNINPVQSSMLQQNQKQFQYRQMQKPLLHRKQQQQQQSQQPQQANQQLQRPTSQQRVNNSSNQCQLLKAVASQDMLSNISPSAPSASSQSSGSHFVVSSPVTSFAPSTIPKDPEKSMSLESPVSHSQSPSFGVEIKSTLDSSSKHSTTEQPPVSLPPEPIAERAIDRLIKAYKSSSPKSLAESFSEISSVVSMVDRFEGSCQHVGGSRGGLGEDLSQRKNFRFHLMTDGETSSNKRMKLSINALPLESEVDSTASSGSKVNKIGSGCVLMPEIKEINCTFVETMVEICDEDVTSGTIVMYSYEPVALTDTFKAHYNSGQISQIQPLRLLVPANYPYSSPILLKAISFDASSQNYEDLSARTRSRFSLSLRKLTEPLSLKQMAQAWNDCARATMVEYATRHGGGTFGSKYGAWDTVFRAP